MTTDGWYGNLAEGEEVKDTSRDTLTAAHRIASEYDGNLTVRQLYYRLVADDFFPEDRKWSKINGKWVLDLENGSKNADPNYKWLIMLLTDARMAGAFPFDWLLDRTRESHPGKFTRSQDDVSDALENISGEIRRAPESWLWRDRWYAQPIHVSVWVEKEALAGVFERPCEELGVAWFVLRGYSSLSALSQWVDHTAEAFADSGVEEHVVLYFGDHDPDGLEIPRSAHRNVLAIAEVREVELPPIRFERVALTREQIRRYNPPPFPAKETSSRFDGYVRETNLRTAWELDALRPEVLQRLIRDSVAQYFDDDIHRDNASLITAAREEMRKKMQGRGWLKSALGAE